MSCGGWNHMCADWNPHVCWVNLHVGYFSRIKKSPCLHLGFHFGWWTHVKSPCFFFHFGWWHLAKKHIKQTVSRMFHINQAAVRKKEVIMASEKLMRTGTSTWSTCHGNVGPPVNRKVGEHNLWKDPPFLTGKSTISTGPFSIAMLNYQRVTTNSLLGLW